MSDDSNFQIPKNLFWPVLLIGVGFILLLSNLGLIEAVNLYLIFRMWPLILIGLGLNLLFGRENPSLGNILSILLVGIAIVMMMFAQNLGLSSPSGEFITETFSETLGDTESADVNIDIDLGNLTLYGLEDSSDLIQGESRHNLDFSFEVSGSTEKDIRFKLDKRDNFGFLDFGFLELEQPNTEIGLSPEVPISLDINQGSGSSDADLTSLILTGFEADTGSGRLDIQLPSGDYSADLGAGSGSLNIVTGSNADLDISASVGSGRMTIEVGDNSGGLLELDAGSGTITVEVPEGVGVQITGTAGSGSVRTPSNYSHTGGSQFVTTSGVWTSPNFDDADYQIVIEFNIGSGSLVIREK